MKLGFRKLIFRRRAMKSARGGVLSGGFEVKFQGVTKLVYREDKLQLIVPVEPLMRGAGYVVYLSAIRCCDSASDQEEPLSHEAISKIKSNIVSALEFLKVKFQQM